MSGSEQKEVFIEPLKMGQWMLKKVMLKILKLLPLTI